MSTIHNSFEYYEGSQSLLSMLNKNKTGNPLINQLIANNENAYQRKMESMGFSAKASDNKYSKVTKASNSLIDAIENLSKEELYKAQDGKEFDKTPLLKGIINFVTAYNNEISNINSCGGAIKNEFAKEFQESYSSNKEALAAIGISIDKDGRMALNQEKLSTVAVDNIKKLFSSNSGYVKALRESATSINEILGKVQAMKSANYNSKGFML